MQGDKEAGSGLSLRDYPRHSTADEYELPTPDRVAYIGKCCYIVRRVGV
jgi:hypothetical protein